MKKQKRWIVSADKFLTREQVVALSEYLLNQRDLAIARGNNPQAIKDYYAIRVLLETGVRVFEFCDLVLSDVHGQKLSVRHGKGNKARTILLTKTTSNMIKEWLVVRERLGFSVEALAPLFPSRYGTKYTTRGIQKRIETVFAALAFPESLTAHSCRHTYCSFLLESGKVGLPTVKENMGHSSISVTNVYAHGVASLDGVELYPESSSQFSQKDELQPVCLAKKSSNSVKAFLRNANFK